MPTRDPGPEPSTIDRPTGGLSVPAVSPGGERPGDSIGPYRLLEVIGEGGFGVVWLAERREPMVQRVALKIIKPGMDSRAVIARFEQERQALAVMDHANVARVYDAGATPTGRPFFVMELVQGESITEYCDRHTLAVRERLQIFILVCDAVQHAHMKGIIHRDLKPSNVLVTVKDGQPIPKVIDFGVAKAISQTLTDKTIFTETGQLIGTPEYMSPEQAEMGALDIDTRTDVYSLGVLLYELLAGDVPFDSKALRSKGYAEIQRIIREVDPPRPSTRLSGLGQGGSAVAGRRKTVLEDLARLLRRELEWIPLKAIRKDRTQRYQTPRELAEDIGRYLEGEPLRAGPESAGYRLKKLLRRNRGVVAAVAAVLLALCAGLATTLWQARDARLQARAADAARRRAETINEFVEDALLSDDPNAGGRRGMLVADAMMQAVRKIDAGAFRDDPEVEAGLLVLIANILDGNGRSGEALPLAERALTAYRRLYPGDNQQVVLGLAVAARVRQSAGRPAEAEPLFQRALEMARRLYSGDNPEIATGLNNLAEVRKVLGRTAEALPLYQQALDMVRRLNPGDHVDVAIALGNLGSALQALGRGADAEALLAQSLEMHRRLSPADRPELARVLGNVAQVRMELGRVVEAEPMFEQSLEMYRRLFPGDHPDVARALNSLAEVREALGRGAEAEPLYEQSLEMRRRLYSGDHSDVANSLNNLAKVRRELGRLAEAEPLLEQALAMTRRLSPGDHPHVATALNNLASVRRALGRPAEAEPLFEQSLEMNRRLFPGDHPFVATGLNNLASVRQALGRPAEAEPLYREALEMAERALPAGHWQAGNIRRGLGQTLTDLSRFAEAEALLLEAWRILSTAQGVPARHVQQCLEALAGLYQKWDGAEPGKGYDSKAAEWKARLEEAATGQDQK